MPASSSGAPTDADLVAGWRWGDEAAAASLVRRHAAPLARFLRAAGAEDGEVEDLVQEAFFRAFRRIATFRGKSAFRTWLFSIGSNVLKDAWRRRKRARVVSIEDRDLADAGADPHGEAAATDMAARLAEAVRGLPPMQRDVFLLRAQQGLDYEEIARALETSTGAARVHYHHAMKRLKALLD